MQKFHLLKILEITTETTNAVSISFEVPASLKENYSFRSGQYVTLRAKIKENVVSRSYSICSSPNSELLTVAIKIVEGGLFSNYANEALRAGDTIEVSFPEGRFVFDNDGSKKTFFGIAAGSGITPVLSIIKDTLETNGSSKFVLLYGNKSIADTMFHSEIENLKTLYAERFYCHNIYSRENNDGSEYGRIEANVIKYCIRAHSNLSFNKFFICGPEELTVASIKVLEKLGYNKNNILFELFYSKANDTIETETDSQLTKIKITSDYEDFEISMEKNITILDAALNHKIDVPYSCQGGVCSSCVGKITEGTAKMIQNNVLSDGEIADGLTLACQAVPTSDILSIDFDNV